jgi:hypothetical protein
MVKSWLIPPEIIYSPFCIYKMEEKLLHVNPPNGRDILLMVNVSNLTWANICSVSLIEPIRKH